MWEDTVDGRRLHFRLAAINNQNFIMADEETGSWWQQVTGEAIHGPLQGRRLRAVFSDRISLATFKREFPGGRVLRPDPRHIADYYPAGFEDHIARMPTVNTAPAGDALPQRAVVIGAQIDGVAKAFPVEALRTHSVVLDQLGEVPLLVATGPDGTSVRAFDRTVNGRVLEFMRPVQPEWDLVDAETGSHWDFTGRAVSGPLAGQRLRAIQTLSEFWFDWRSYHPRTRVYAP